MHQKKKIWMAVFIVVFFCTAGVWYLLYGRKSGEGNIAEKSGPDSVFATGTVSPTQTPTATSAPTPAEDGTLPLMIYVYVCGAVVNPGVYALPEGSRMFEAVALAGGCLLEADEAYHNLARILSDGERIYILSKEESAGLSLKERVEGEETVQGGSMTGEAGTAGTEMVNLNTATVEQLTTLPGIGESRAESIIAYRKKVGRFLDIEEIMNISGIGEAMFEKIKDRITVE